MSEWNEYFKNHQEREPQELLLRAVENCTNKDNALDLGSGTLIESKFLIENGFKHVTAIDSSPETKVFASGIDPEIFELHISSFQDFEFKKDTYDLINAQYSLPFNGSEKFTELIEKIISSLTPGGIFVGQFFGIRDEWNTTDTKMMFLSKEEALNMLSKLTLIEFTEEEKDAGTAAGNQKHWHTLHFIAKK